MHTDHLDILYSTTWRRDLLVLQLDIRLILYNYVWYTCHSPYEIRIDVAEHSSQFDREGASNHPCTLRPDNLWIGPTINVKRTPGGSWNTDCISATIFHPNCSICLATKMRRHVWPSVRNVQLVLRLSQVWSEYFAISFRQRSSSVWMNFWNWIDRDVKLSWDGWRWMAEFGWSVLFYG